MTINIHQVAAEQQSRAQRLGLEPESTDSRIEFGDPLDREIAHSIAISLKRIADLEERMLALHEQATHDMAEIKSRSQP